MHIIQVETQTIETLVAALVDLSSYGMYDYTKAEKVLLAEVRILIEAREFFTVAQHQAIVHMAVKYL